MKTIGKKISCARLQGSPYSFACPKKTPKPFSRWLTNGTEEKINNGNIIALKNFGDRYLNQSNAEIQM